MTGAAYFLLFLMVHYNHAILLCEESAIHYTIITSTNETCEETEQCLTLSQLANNSSEYLNTNTTVTLHFLEGEHHLNSTIMIRNINAFHMSSERDSNITIICNDSSSRFEVYNVSFVHISDLTFFQCARNQIINVGQFKSKDLLFLGNKDIVIGTVLELVKTSAEVTRTEFRHNHGNKVTTLYCLTYHHYASVGGAIALTHSNLTIIDSVFEGNSAEAGGAIFAEHQSNITIINSTFVGNQATSMHPRWHCYAGGGVLYSHSDDTSVIYIVHNSTFEHNTADENGGVMATGLRNSIILIITDSRFTSNVVHNGNGGVMSSRRPRLLHITITGSEVTDNAAFTAGGVMDLDGGDFSMILTITDSKFANNSASIGAVLVNTWSFKSIIAIRNTEFTNNSAHLGGVMEVNHLSGLIINISDSNFTANKAYGYGGVAHVQYFGYSLFTINNCFFTDHSDVMEEDECHKLESSLSVLVITSSKFEKNSAAIDGSVIAMKDAALIVNQSAFIDNKAGDKGGTISIYEGIVNISHSQFHNIMARRGGVIWANSSTINTYNTTFSNNTANVDGGVLYAYNSSLLITGANFSNNRADNNGGIIYSERTLTMIVNSRFRNNKAENDGGVLRSYVGKIDILKSDYHSNSANNEGGVFHIVWTNMTIDQTSFANNKASTGVHLSHSSAHVDGGVLYAQDSTVIITGANFSHNRADSNGGIMSIRKTMTTIVKSKFKHNKAGNDGGVIQSYLSNIDIFKSDYYNNSANNEGGVFHIERTNLTINQTSSTNNKASTTIHLSYNMAYVDGGVIYSLDSTVVITGVNFSYNRADNNGGIMFIHGTMTTIVKSKFNYNKARNDGGVIRSYYSHIDIFESDYSNNSANNEGGVFHIDQTNVTINKTSFTSNKANDGGVIWVDQGDIVSLNRCYFTDNTASIGGVIWSEQTTVNANTVNITYNYANGSVVYLLESNSDWSDMLYSNNIGSLYAYGGSLNIRKDSKLVNNTMPNKQYNSHPLIKEGGTITVVQSKITFYGNSSLTEGHASSGGALTAAESGVHIYGNVTVANNRAKEAGGGVYLYHCELICYKSCNLKLQNNTATEKGGGISAIGSVIKIKSSHAEQSSSSIQFNSNHAMNGGGLYLGIDSKVYILKSKFNKSKSVISQQTLISFSLNSATQYGGAIYVSDNGMCSISTKSIVNECFIQTLAMYASMTDEFDDTRCQNIDFVHNTAMASGNSLFGGLLDRCSVSQFAEVNMNTVNMNDTFSNDTMIVKGYEYFKKISNVNDDDIGSYPVKVCFCINGEPDCSYKPDPLRIRKGQKGDITLTLAVVNQINYSIDDVKIYSRFFPEKYLCQNHVQHIYGTCRNVSFRAFSYNETEELVLSFHEGPCKDTPESEARVTLEFFCPPCSVGLERDDTREGCQCVCDSQLSSYFTNCSDGTLIRDNNVWITNLTTNNNSNVHQYLIHPHCPFDYCHPPSLRVAINLSMLNGADAQCANSRSGLLCGVCQHNFSLSLGSSRCLSCPTNQLAVLIPILIAAILAGIILVTLLLVLNLTVAIGTLNGIIFYANIVYASNGVFFPSTTQNFVTAFISWLNLEIGFDTCFFVNMDAFSKTLLQLAFPGYVFFLVFLIIIISKYSIRFSRLIAKHNPVATLATLISLSYAKFLQINIASLSFAVFRYSNGFDDYVWLVDASVGYLRGKHIVLFIIAVFIIIAGFCFTTILLFWQWLLRHQDKAIFKWTKYQKLCHIIETFHAPFVDKHRYWAGLLFLVRVVLYIIFALNENGDPRVCLVTIILTTGGLLLTKGFLVKVYKKWPIDVMESITYFNILGFASLTWYYIGTPARQTAVAYTSVIITLLFLLMVIAFHACKFTPLGSIIQRITIFNAIAIILFHDSKKKAKDNDLDPHPPEPEPQERGVSFSVIDVPRPILEHCKSEINVQLRPQDLPCYTPPDSIENQDSKV